MRESYPAKMIRFKIALSFLCVRSSLWAAADRWGVCLKMLTLSGYQVRILEQQDWPRAVDIVADAGMVIVSVPIHVTEQVIAQLPPFAV
ncbi:hypothetical protein KCP71_13095 [Salmonella enterica subsp. enterica]|nr:hypothetical protein KCP71_13095 [Salmonella enterica subsp. enterica]